MRAADQRAADQRAADQRAADERAADERAADERAVLKLVDAMIDTRRRAAPAPRVKRKAS